MNRQKLKAIKAGPQGLPTNAPRPTTFVGILLFAMLSMGLLTTPFQSIAASGSKAERMPFRLAIGKKRFEQSCASCHGQQVMGSDKGPPLIHKYYEPNHHGDASFFRAVSSGVKQHHWRFGDMPAVSGVSPRDTQQIINYVRWLQQQKGIF